MPAVSLTDLVTGWSLDPAAALVIGLAAALYAQAVRRLARKGRRWPAGRSVAMGAALTLATVATQSGVARYEDHRLWVHMVQHVLIGMAVPLLVVLSAPLTLALQTARPGTRRVLRRSLHGRAAHVLSHPLVGWCLFGGGMAVLYLTPLLDVAEDHALVHLAVHTHMLTAGLLFLAPLVGVDPLPRRLPHPARLLALLAAVPFHAVVALAMTSSTTPIAPETYPLLDDQRTAAALFWGSGEIFTLVAAAVIVRQWWRAEQRAAAREDAALDAAALAAAPATATGPASGR
ncbi:MAG TPA: cytochrome c oxidase assembly protein [Acidimicrobiales bacterium]|nr:cytochrome c oxidase assembly protein [Acidimicrobiales bacterium]